MVESLQDKLVPVIAYVIAAINSRSLTSFSGEGKKKKSSPSTVPIFIDLWYILKIYISNKTNVFNWQYS